MQYKIILADTIVINILFWISLEILQIFLDFPSDPWVLLTGLFIEFFYILSLSTILSIYVSYANLQRL